MQITYFLPGMCISSAIYIHQSTLLCTKLNQVHSHQEQLRLMLKKQLKAILQETTPAYWKQFRYYELAMFKKLGIHKYFLTLSIIDLRWAELACVINKPNNLGISDEELKKLS